MNPNPYLVVNPIDLRKAPTPATPHRTCSAPRCENVAAWSMMWPSQTRRACDHHLAEGIRNAFYRYDLRVKVAPR